MLIRLLLVALWGIPLSAYSAQTYSRTCSFSQVYAASSFSDHAGALLTIKNISAIDQNIKINGGMKWLLTAAESYNTGLTAFGEYMAGWHVRGAPNGALLSSGASVSAKPTVSPWVGGSFGGGFGTTVSAVDGPLLKLKPGESVFLQTERYAAGAHGAIEMDISVVEPRGALIASGIVYTQQINLTNCPNVDPCGKPIAGSSSITSFALNGARPF